MSEQGAVEIIAPEIPAKGSQAGHKNLIKWAPGQSGNPAGFSKRFREVTHLAQEKSVQAIEKLSVLMNCGDERVEIMAANAILDRAFGKPKEVKQDDSAQHRPDLSRLSVEDLAALRRVMVSLASANAPESG